MNDNTLECVRFSTRYYYHWNVPISTSKIDILLYYDFAISLSTMNAKRDNNYFKCFTIHIQKGIQFIKLLSEYEYNFTIFANKKQVICWTYLFILINVNVISIKHS